VGKTPQRSVAAKFDLISAGDDLIQSEPPKFAGAVGIVGRHVKGEGQIALLEQRIGVLEIVAIAIIEGEADEALVVAVFRPLHGLVERDYIEVRLLHLIEHGIEELRRHFEDAVRRKGARLLRLGPDMVQREDEAGALRVRGEQAVGAGMVESRHRRLHHGGFHFGQGRSPFPPQCPAQIAATRPSNRERGSFPLCS
jgi:hypothetical protein